jgi:hypothetical protein
MLKEIQHCKIYEVVSCLNMDNKTIYLIYYICNANSWKHKSTIQPRGRDLD